MSIQIQPEEMRNKASEFQTNKDEQTQVIENCRNLLDQLVDDGFSGATADAFSSKWSELEPSLISASDLLGEIGNALKTAADNFENLDQEMASFLR